MRNPFATGVGGVLSADIAVPDHERELGFYAKVLTTGKAPLWRDDLTNNQGTPVIGLGARSPEYEALPLQWMPHFQVADVADSAARALELGGKEIMHVKGDDGQSQWAVLVDHIGAAFGVIPVVPDESIAADKSVLPTRDFYQQVVGWSATPADVEGGFEMQRPDGVSSAEIRHARSDKEGIPPVWILSLPVDDFEESLRRVREGGGEVVKESTDGRYAVIRDPVGVCLALQAKK
jgi:predicted enzyme related to lactoylglutathione lyase